MARKRATVLEQKIAAIWPDRDVEEIKAILGRYGAGRETVWGRRRVHLAALKLCGGDLDKLTRYVEMANRDYRDVVAYAEYPEASRLGFVEMAKLSEAEAKAVRRRDKQQYQRWLRE